jgi:hypothetical protein
MLNERLLKRAGGGNAEQYVKVFRELADMAAESNAETAAATIAWHGDNDESDMPSDQYIPEITIRVRLPRGQ